MRNPFFPFASGIYFFKLRMRSLGKLNVSRESWMEKWIYGLWFRSILTVSYLDRLPILVCFFFFFFSFELCTKFLGLGSLGVWLLRERNAVVPGSHDSTPTPELPVGACWLIFSVWESGGWSDLCSSLGVTHLQLLKVCFRTKFKTKTKTKKTSVASYLTRTGCVWGKEMVWNLENNFFPSFFPIKLLYVVFFNFTAL